MLEKHGALWVDLNNEGSADVVFEHYCSEQDKLFIIYKRSDALFMPFAYTKKPSQQWRFPFWGAENDKVIMQTMEEAKVFLRNLGLEKD